jgi:hypothetical protein
VRSEAIGPFIVTTDDGRMFHCSVVGETERQRRWVLRDSDGRRYDGPDMMAERSPDAVRRLVNEWWKLRKELEMNH